MAEMIASKKQTFDAKIKPDNRVANDEYFRAVKDDKIMGKLQKKQNEKTMARTRFDQDPTVVSPSKGDALVNENDIERAELMLAANHTNTNPNTVNFIDPTMDPKYAIQRIQLPPKTMYLIDKVVRAKALQGPIGVNNSEVINLEQERELRKKNLYYANLAEKKRTNPSQMDDDMDPDEDGERVPTNNGRNSKGEFIDDEEVDLDDQERDNARNEALLKRLYNVAQ
jgi:hypothetical protein